MTLEDLARLANSDVGTLSRIENGKMVPRLSPWDRIARALDLPVERVLGIETEKRD